MNTPVIHDLPYRPCVGIVLLNRQGLVFLGARIQGVDGVAWQMPQGGIDPGETPEAAVMRELEEEVGTDKAEILAKASDWFHYDLPVEIVGRVMSGRYRGQRMMWFALRFLGEDADIDVNTEIPEFSDWRWAEIDEAVELIVDFKRPVYERVADEFRSVIATLRSS